MPYENVRGSRKGTIKDKWQIRWSAFIFYGHCIYIYYCLAHWNMNKTTTWWRYDMETFSALMAFGERNPPVTGGFRSQRASDTGLDFIGY